MLQQPTGWMNTSICLFLPHSQVKLPVRRNNRQNNWRNNGWNITGTTNRTIYRTIEGSMLEKSREQLTADDWLERFVLCWVLMMWQKYSECVLFVCPSIKSAATKRRDEGKCESIDNSNISRHFFPQRSVIAILSASNCKCVCKCVFPYLFSIGFLFSVSTVWSRAFVTFREGVSVQQAQLWCWS